MAGSFVFCSLIGSPQPRLQTSFPGTGSTISVIGSPPTVGGSLCCPFRFLLIRPHLAMPYDGLPLLSETHANVRPGLVLSSALGVNLLADCGSLNYCLGPAAAS